MREDVRMRIPDLFVIHPTREKQNERDEHHGEQALVCAEVLQRLHLVSHHHCRQKACLFPRLWRKAWVA